MKSLQSKKLLKLGPFAKIIQRDSVARKGGMWPRVAPPGRQGDN